MLNSSIWLIDRTLLDATTPGQSGPGSNDNDGALRIPQSSSITGASPSDCFVSYPDPRLFSWAVWHSCPMGARNQEQTRGRIGPQLRLGNLRVGELHFCPHCTALDQASSLSRKLAYVPGLTFGFVKLLASSGSHCTKWADEQHWQAGFESRLLPDLPLPFIPTLIGLRAFDLVSSRVWWEAATNIGSLTLQRSSRCILQPQPTGRS